MWDAKLSLKYSVLLYIVVVMVLYSIITSWDSVVSFTLPLLQ